MSGILKYFGKKRKAAQVTSSMSSFSDQMSLTSTDNLQPQPESSTAPNDLQSETSASDLQMSLSVSDHIPESDMSSTSTDNLQSQSTHAAPPSDFHSEISATGDAFFENKTAPNQPRLKIYPPTLFGTKSRRFNASWYKSYTWLEYNEEIDAAFCFACRVFPSKSKHGESTFVTTGFRDWKNATDKSKGFTKHISSQGHQFAMENWLNFTQRSSTSVTQSLMQVTDKQKKWLFAVFIVTRYLCANGLSFRGTDESEILEGDGLFLRTFSELIFPLDDSWKTIFEYLPQNAKYTSPTIQNEIISVLAELVKQIIAMKVRQAKLYTIMADGTTDKNKIEVQGLVMRYMCVEEGKVMENCISMEGINDRSAAGILGFIESTLKECQVSLGGMVSQSYDGASVMSGEHSGLQARINYLCERTILYIHCFLHRISLVVVEVMKTIDELKNYFQITSSLYAFFKKAAVIECYEGSPLKRLIQTRWSGHFDSVLHINKNYSEITHALAIASKSVKLDTDDKALAIGLLSQMSDDLFPFINCMLLTLLKPINIIVKQLQSSSENIVVALNVVNAVRHDLKEIRGKLSTEMCEELLEEFRQSTDIISYETRVRRNTSAPQHFRDFFISECIPSENTTRSKLQIYAETLDLLISEFDRRFSSENTDLWKAMEALSPDSKSFLDFETLKPWYGYCESIPVIKELLLERKVSLDDLEAECRIFKRVLNKIKWAQVNETTDLVAVAVHVRNNHQSTAPVLTTLYDAAITAGWTSTRCECVFSALSRIDTPQRRSMKTKRECELAFLNFESKILMEEITFDMFFKAWKSKPRKIDV